MKVNEIETKRPETQEVADTILTDAYSLVRVFIEQYYLDLICQDVKLFNHSVKAFKAELKKQKDSRFLSQVTYKAILKNLSKIRRVEKNLAKEGK